MRTATIALALLAFSATRALAAEPWKVCADFQSKAASALIVTRTCSDAAYVRRNPDEATVICVLAANAAGEAADLYGQMKANKDSPLLADCARDEELHARQLVAAMEWQHKILGTLNTSAPEPGPFKPN